MVFSRRDLRYIPVFLPPRTYDPDHIQLGFERCQREIAGDFEPNRRPWRTLVRVVEVDAPPQDHYFHVVVPGWDPKVMHRVHRRDIPDELQAKIQPDQRLFAEVNLGALTAADLYLSEWKDK